MWSKRQIIRLNTLVEVIRVPKVRTSCQYKPIDTNCLSILLLVSVFFRRPLTFFQLVGGIGGLGGIKMASASTPPVNEPTRASF